jgi:phosphate transport system substrate-binding protein
MKQNKGVCGMKRSLAAIPMLSLFSLLFLPLVLLSGCAEEPSGNAGIPPETFPVVSGAAPDTSLSDAQVSETPAVSPTQDASSATSATPTSPEPTILPGLEPPEPEVVPFRFTRENFPHLDGSTSMVPLGEAIACVLLGEPREAVRELINFSKTTMAYRSLYNGWVDIVIAAEPDWDSINLVFNSDDAKDMIELTPIALDALVFIVNKSNPVDNLTTEQVQKIYTGEIANWRQVGGDDVKITAFQRNKESGSQVLMDKLVMPGLALAPTPVQYIPSEMGELITGIKGFDRTSSAIGYTVYYYANDMNMAEGLKILSIDGIKPGNKTIAGGEYPYINPYYTAISKYAAQDSPERILYNWLLSDEGRSLVKSEGYVPVEG